ncbi:MAPEG family protein [Puniceibacterium confluentis]|uniref:MAPEG family protein n=1 Tax=Puniceibacterium confluentis TaxID=1958944 RepID=UPI0011B71E34|nr:MAPEG family protein [Puniceibacterium confluentis]
MEQFVQYSHATASLALWALIILALSGLSLRGRTPENRCGCGKPIRDYANPVYRSERAFQNAIETSGPFIAATLAGILAGAAPFWVNLLASVFVLARIAMAVVHIRTENQPMRSACYGVSWLCVVLLALFALVAAF